jgi:hypothetical protein
VLLRRIVENLVAPLETTRPQTPSSKLMKYKICEWEDNGYHDSYFYGVYYDTNTGLMKEIQLGATAYAGGSYSFGVGYEMPTLEIIEKCRVLMAAHIFTVISNAEYRDVFLPEDAKEKDTVRLLVPHSGMVMVEKPCQKCEGKGHWQNPCREADKRPCFACHGRGRKRSKEKARTPGGKILRFTLPVDTVFTVQACTAFGTFYRNGYNKPNRSVLSIAGDGQLYRIPLAKLRMDRDPMPEEELRQRAEALSHEHQYGAMFGCKAWLSANFIQVVLGRHAQHVNRTFEKAA